MGVSTDKSHKPNVFWVFYDSSPEQLIDIRREVDNVFSDYIFYPEIEWGKYGYRAPEGHQVVAAWRHPHTKLFSFLLDNPRMASVEPETQLLLLMTGDKSEIEKLEPKCEQIKSKFSAMQKRQGESLIAEATLNSLQRSKPLAIVTAIIAVLTAIINGFSLYLRKLPPPPLSHELLVAAYQLLISLVHLSALILLLIVIIFLGIFFIKCARLILRRFW